MRIENSIFGTLEGLWRWIWSMDCRNRVTSCKRSNWILLDKNFKSKSIKEEGKIPNQQFQHIQSNKIFYMAQQFTITPILPNPYANWTLNNMNLVKTMNNEQKD